MRTRLLALTLLLISVASPAFAGLNQVFTQNGNLGVEVAGYGNGNVPPVMGTLTLNNVPPSAIIVRATLYATDVTNGTALTGTFNGGPLPLTGPFASDPSLLTLFAYQWDVTAQVNAGLTSYPVSMGTNVGTANQIAGVGMVVVWSDASEPNRTISIVEGIKQVGESGPETESTVFAGMPGGPTTVWIFTTTDDAAASGESVVYNLNPIGGPIDANVGLNASVLSMSATSLAGNNALSITTQNDSMAWVLAVLADTPQATPTQSATWGRIKALYR